MIDRGTINDILDISVYAPSGDNSQPWLFYFDGNQLFIFNEPEKDNPIFNYRQRGSYVAQGALIENISIVSKKYGYDAEIHLFPEKSNLNVIAKILFKSSNSYESSLANCIKSRATNRKEYKTEELSHEETNGLLAAGSSHPQIHFDLITGKKEIGLLGQCASMNEVVMLENRQLHSLFFNDIRWSLEEEKENKTGLFVETMELKPPQLLIFKLLRNWNVARFLNIFGFAKFIARENSKIYSSCPAFGVICMKDLTAENFVKLGRVLQRIWLTATELKLNMHLLTGVIFLAQRILAGEGGVLSAKHGNLIQETYNKIIDACDKRGENIVMLFRIGKGEGPSAFSEKLPPRFLDKL